MKFEQPELPYHKDELAPHISKETVEYHYNKHHRSYFDKLNNLVLKTEFENMQLEKIIRHAEGAIFNNAAQAWNHTFYWQSLSPTGGGEPEGILAEKINDSFVSFVAFKEAFTNSALTNFGSGWTWLLINGSGKLEIMNTSNADTPIRMSGFTPILVCDIWEHAYYIDYRNARPKYLDAFWELVNWDFATSNLQA